MTCACGDGKLCAEHLGAWLDRKPHDAWSDFECANCGCYRCNHLVSRGHCLVADCECSAYAKPWRSFPAEPTCERCIVKVEGGWVMRKCDACVAATGLQQAGEVP